MIKPGMLISDRYEIIEKVGSGGMADVYKAKCHRLNRFVAIKVLKPEFSSDRSFVNKFRGEAQSAAGLSHPNVVNVYDVGDDNGLYYIVMELVEGITLKKFIERKGKLEVKEAIGISIQIAQGMEAAHANHIIHRDIKPQNIIISKEGKVKVTDFGIAKATTSNTITSNAMGSVHYLSPEQARGGYSDEKSDIYSLGVTMYEMLSGQVPFAGDNNVSVALAHIQGEAKPLHEVDQEIPHGVDMIVQKCMQKKPERRYLSASELIVDLKKAISNPNGDFVHLVSPVVMDSPTISLSDEEIRNINSITGNNTNDYSRQQPKSDPENNDEEEDEDIDSVNPQVTKLLIGFSIPVVLIIVILIVWLVTKLVTSVGDGGHKNNVDDENGNPFEITQTVTPSITEEAISQVTMIDVTNRTKEEAIQQLKALSLEFDIQPVKEAYSDEIEKGKICEQFPTAGTSIAANSKITLTISAGTEGFALDNYKGKDYEVVYKALTELELKVAKNEVYDNDIDAGKVVSTAPVAKSIVTKGDEIVINVSKGAELVSVPNLINMKEADARAEILSRGLEVGKVTEESSNKYDAGTVKYQSYSYGEKVEKGTEIDLSISTGPEATQTPTPEPTVTPEPEQPTTSEEDKEYETTFTIPASIFDEGQESGMVALDLYQNGVSEIVYEEELSASELPKKVVITSENKESGTITIYVNERKISGDTWQVSFTEAK